MKKNRYILLLEEKRKKYLEGKTLNTTMDLGVIATVITAENRTTKAYEDAENFYVEIKELLDYIINNPILVGGYYRKTQQKVRFSHERVYCQQSAPSVLTHIVDGEIIIRIAADGEISASFYVKEKT